MYSSLLVWGDTKEPVLALHVFESETSAETQRACTDGELAVLPPPDFVSLIDKLEFPAERLAVSGRRSGQPRDRQSRPGASPRPT